MMVVQKNIAKSPRHSRVTSALSSRTYTFAKSVNDQHSEYREPPKSARVRSASHFRSKDQQKAQTRTSLSRQSVADEDLQKLYVSLLEKFHEQNREKDHLEAEGERKDTILRRREIYFQTQISQLQSKLDRMTTSHSTNTDSIDEMQTLNSIRAMHDSLQNNICLIQDRTTQMLQDQERDLLRAFNEQVNNLNKELRIERQKNDNGSSEWIRRYQQLSDELEKMRKLTQQLEKTKITLKKENKKLFREKTIQEDNKKLLLKNILLVKQENAFLLEKNSFDAECTHISSSSDIMSHTMKNSPIHTHSSHRSASRAQSARTKRAQSATAATEKTLSSELEKRFLNTIRHLKNQLNIEQKKSRSLTTKLNERLNQRGQLQECLHTCIVNVRKEIKKNSESNTRLKCTIQSSTSAREQESNAKEVDNEKDILSFHESILRALEDQAIELRLPMKEARFG